MCYNLGSEVTVILSYIYFLLAREIHPWVKRPLVIKIFRLDSSFEKYISPYLTNSGTTVFRLLPSVSNKHVVLILFISHTNRLPALIAGKNCFYVRLEMPNNNSSIISDESFCCRNLIVRFNSCV